VSERVVESLESAREAMHSLGDLLADVRQLFRWPDPGRLVGLPDLPRELQIVCNALRFDGSIDFSPLTNSDRRIGFTPYFDAFSFALQAALLSLRQVRRPALAIGFAVEADRLSTTFSLTHREELAEVDAPLSSWAALKWAVISSNGKCTITRTENATLVEWHFPLL